MRNTFSVIALLALLGGCASLPEDGPSARGVQAGSQVAGQKAYALVDLDYRVGEAIRANPPRQLASLVQAGATGPVNLIGEGDVLSVSLYEPSAGPRTDNDKGSGDGGGAQVFQHLTVDADGQVGVPFAGRVRVAGLSPDGAAGAVRKALAGRMINPQVLVSVTANMANAVTVIGEVRTAGRFPLSANNDRLLDALAVAGGPSKPASDIQLSIVRGAQTVSAPLDVVMNDPGQNVRLAPRDQVRLVYHPRKFSTFGAIGHASQVSIEDESLSLAGALSRIGGLDTNNANASSVLVFRFERPEVARALGLTLDPAASGVPVVYRLNLREPSGYFVAQKFDVQADDLIYVPRADAAEVRKFFSLVSDITQVAYNVALVRVVN